MANQHFRSVMRAEEAWERGFRADGVQVPPGSSALVLYDTTLVEDDGPGASTWHAPAETIRGELWARKVFQVSRPQATAAQLVMHVVPFDDETEPLTVRFNRQEFTFRPASGGWQVLAIPPTAIRKGRNEVTLSCATAVKNGWRVPVALREAIVRNDPARKNAPARSFRSADHGRTWTTKLGDGHAVAGEYLIRLNLAQHAAQGELIGPVLDLAGAEAGLAGETVVATNVKVTAQADLLPGTALRFHVRSGVNPVCGTRGWGKWVACDKSGDARGRFGRFLQWRATLKTSRPTVTPALSEVAVAAEVSQTPSAWAGRLQVASAHNEAITYTSIPYEYERYDQPQLRELRKKYRLDRVVAKGKTELEKMTLLRNWVSKQWRYLPFEWPHTAWDAREILDRHSGVCVQYAIVYMQCALAIGMQTRFVFGHVPNGKVAGRSTGGHEVNEYWSNDHGRWFYLDARQDDTFFDARTGQPVSMLGFHDEMLRTYFPDRPMNFALNDLEKKLTSEVLRFSGQGDERPRPEPAEIPVMWGCIAMVPRNNFYAHRFPEPIAQGRSYWSWTGYWNWWDAKTPRHPRYGRYTCRRADFEWTLNQVRWAAAPARQTGTVKLTMGTVTPDFDTFLVRTGGRGPWRPAGANFAWTLRRGRNRLEMRVRTKGGILGRVSHLEVKF